MQQTLLYKKIIEVSEGTSEYSITRLFDTAVCKIVKKGDIVLNIGAVCNHIFFVEKGYLRVFVMRDGVEINVEFFFENEFVTDLKSLRSETPCELTIITGEEAVLYQFDKHILLSLYKDFPDIESFGRKLLEQLLMAQQEHNQLFKLFSAIERYRYLENHKPQIIRRVSLSQIASYLGVARETLSRIRKLK